MWNVATDRSSCIFFSAISASSCCCSASLCFEMDLSRLRDPMACHENITLNLPCHSVNALSHNIRLLQMQQSLLEIKSTVISCSNPLRTGYVSCHKNSSQCSCLESDPWTVPSSFCHCLVVHWPLGHSLSPCTGLDHRLQLAWGSRSKVSWFAKASHVVLTWQAYSCTIFCSSCM